MQSNQSILKEISPGCSLEAFPGGEGAPGPLQFKSLMHSAFSEHLLYAWPCAGYIETSKEKSSLSRQYKRGQFGVQKIESYGSTGFQEAGFLAYLAQGDQEGPLGGRLLG